MPITLRQVSSILSRYLDRFLLIRADVLVESFSKEKGVTFPFAFNEVKGGNPFLVTALTNLLASISPTSSPFLHEALKQVLRYTPSFTSYTEYIFQFPFSPRSLQVTFAALENVSEYGGNIMVRVGWGNKLVPLTVTGWVNLFPPNVVVKTLGYAEYRLSWGWLTLFLLEHWLKRNVNHLLFILLNGRLWTGWFSRFSYSLDAHKIFSAEWTLTFNVHPLSGISIFDYPSIIDMFTKLRKTGMLASLSYDRPDNWAIFSR